MNLFGICLTFILRKLVGNGTGLSEKNRAPSVFISKTILVPYCSPYERSREKTSIKIKNRASQNVVHFNGFVGL